MFTRTIKGRTYRCEPLPTVEGCAKVLYIADDGACYEVFVDGELDRAACECRGFFFWGKCKHVADVREMMRE